MGGKLRWRPWLQGSNLIDSRKMIQWRRLHARYVHQCADSKPRIDSDWFLGSRNNCYAPGRGIPHNLSRKTHLILSSIAGRIRVAPKVVFDEDPFSPQQIYDSR